ncbi:MAG TPA: PRC-barrel domain-containing protein [Polyangiaceae bacterium]
MLRSLKALERYKVSATDGDIGHVEDFLLDDERWAIRYLVVKTNGLFDGDQVLITPISFRQVDWAAQQFDLALTREKVRDSPSVDTDKPVSRQHEWNFYQYYQYPHYWEHPGLWGTGAHPELLATCGWKNEPVQRPADVHLHSALEVRGYHIQGNDEAIGHVEDFVVDDETWEICYLVVDTSNWGFGKKVLIAPRWATSISWEERKVHVSLSRELIKDSPEWDATDPINREYETRLYDYYGRPTYWDSATHEEEAAARHGHHP